MDTFKSNIINIYGTYGKEWLENLPRLISEIAIKLRLSGLTPVSSLSFNYVVSGFQKKRPVILKLGPDIIGLEAEGVALNVFSGFGVVNIIAKDKGLLLLEQAIPGCSLKPYFPAREEETIGITANLMKRLHRAPIPRNHAFPHLKDWLVVLDEDWEIPHHYLQKARQLRNRLLQTSAKEVLLHGDLHHDNILQNSNDWVVIDPKGVIGEPAYEVASFIQNPIPELLQHDNASNILGNRINHFANALKLPPRRILDWCFVQAILAWVWALEDNCPYEYFKQITGVFYQMIIEKG